MRRRPFEYSHSCVGVPQRDVAHLHNMIDHSREVTFNTLRRYCEGIEDWAKSMGYAARRKTGLLLADDWSVSFHKSTYNGRPCFYIRHSAIEYIWIERGSDDA